MSSRPTDFIYPGVLAAQAIHAAVQLRIPDLLRSGPRSVADLAAESGAHAASLERLLRALTAMEVFRREPDGRYRNSPQSDLLRSDHPLSLVAIGRFLPSAHMWRALGELPDSVRTGEAAFDRAWGQSFFSYLEEHPEEAAVFNRLMTQEITWITPLLRRAYDFTRFHKLVDVGGGEGMFLRAILEAAPGLQGVLFDQPQVVAAAARNLTDGLAGRAVAVGGSFFEGVPEGGDVYTLKRILHDWSDEDAARILRNIRRAMQPGGTLLVLESLVDSPTHPAGLADLMMLVLGGRERTEADFRALFHSAGFALQRVVPVGTYALLESRPI